MKRTSIIALALVFALALTGCYFHAEDHTPPPRETPAPGETPQFQPGGDDEMFTLRPEEVFPLGEEIPLANDLVSRVNSAALISEAEFQELDWVSRDRFDETAARMREADANAEPVSLLLNVTFSSVHDIRAGDFIELSVWGLDGDDTILTEAAIEFHASDGPFRNTHHPFYWALNLDPGEERTAQYLFIMDRGLLDRVEHFVLRQALGEDMDHLKDQRFVKFTLEG